MNINATLLGQLFSFFIFVWFCKNYIWPPIIKHMEDRQTKIANGLRDAERAEHELQIAKDKAQDYVVEAKEQAGQLVEAANKRAAKIIEEATLKAKQEGQRLQEQAEIDIAKQESQVKESLRREVVKLSILGAEKILEEKIDEKQHQVILEKVAGEL